MKPGSYVFSSTRSDNKVFLVTREISFSEYCKKHDDLMLEYDIDDAWSAWEKNGPCFEVLSSDGIVCIMWKNIMVSSDIKVQT